MPTQDAVPRAPTLPELWRARLERIHPAVRWSVGAALAVVLGLLLAGAVAAFSGQNRAFLGYALAGGTAGFAATALGALSAFAIRTIKIRTQDCMLGFAAGMMLAASAFSLLLPGLEAGQQLLDSAVVASAVVVLGLGLGVLLMLALDYLTPHVHESVGPHGPQAARIGGVWLFVLAIILHNLPEGMAIGVSFAHGDWSVGLPLTTAIAIQDIPEGLAVAIALRAIGQSLRASVLIGVLSGLMEPLGAVVGVGMASGFPLAYPISLGLAAGAMIFVVSHEVIPETHRNGHETTATIGLMLGFGLMMFLDTALG